MRLVPLPSDSSTFVDLDKVVAMKTVSDGMDGTVVLPTSHGEASVAVSVASRWVLELTVGPGIAYSWETYDEPAQAQQEMSRIAQWIWTREREER